MNGILLALLLGVIEGITEFLPISSTGHLLLFQNLIGNQQSELFNVVIQVAAVIAVIPLFWNRIAFMFNIKNKDSRDLLIKTTVAFGATGFFGLVFKKLGLELPSSSLPIAWALLIGGIIFIWVESRNIESTSSKITWKVVTVAVLGQIIAMVFPGASRSGSTIMLMLLVGLNREVATEFSFLIGIPTMLAAGGYEAYDAIKEGANIDYGFLAISSIFSAITAFISVKWLLTYIKKNSFVIFGQYRILLSLLLFILILLKIL